MGGFRSSRHCVVLAVYLLFLVFCFFTVHEHLRGMLLLVLIYKHGHEMLNAL